MSSKNVLLIPSEAERSTYTPMHYFDFELAKTKKMIQQNHLSDKYLTLQMSYKSGLMKYLTDILMLDEYEKWIKENPLRFIPCTAKEQSVYQKYSMTNFNYIYLRNNLYIEKLELEEIEILETLMNKKEDLNDDKLLELVARTYQNIIKIEDRAIDTEGFYVIYENRVNEIKSAFNNAIILEVNTISEFDKEDNYVSLENEEKKDLALIKLKNKMTTEISGILEVPVVVFIK